MARLRQLASDTVLYGISTVVSRFLNYLLVPFYTKFFDPAAYGIIGLIYGAMIFLNVLFTFGMESTYLRYGAEEADRKRVYTQLQSLVFWASLILGALFFVGSPIVKPLISLETDSFHLYEMMIGIIVLDAWSVIPFAQLRLERKALWFMILRVSNVLINVGLNLYLVVQKGMGLEAVLISNAVASLVTTLAVWALNTPKLTLRLESDFIKKSLTFGLPYIPAGLGYAINEVLDRFLINAMSPADIEKMYGLGVTAEQLTGIYNACYKLGIFMMLFIQMFRMAWQPFYMSHHKDEQAKSMFSKSFLAINGVAALLVLGIGFFKAEIAAIRIPYLDAYLIGEVYWSGLSIVPYLLIAYWFQLWYTHLTAGIVLAEKTSILPKATLIGAGVTLVANVILLPFYGLNGAAWATLLSYGTMAYYMLYQSSKYYPVVYPWKSMTALIIGVLTLFVLF
ncbi:lipopolysaccharide biosynthesis protein [bacterium]|nr:MAG: lipopolysaccharide biosynthesis protein [bacterium]